MALPLLGRLAAGAVWRSGSSNAAAQFTIRKQSNNINPRLKKLRKNFKKIVKEGHDEFVKQTPIDTGNARRKTDLKDNEIQGNYPYSVRLQNGYSKQAPDGMRDDAIDHMRDFIKKI